MTGRNARPDHDRPGLGGLPEEARFALTVGTMTIARRLGRLLPSRSSARPGLSLASNTPELALTYQASMEGEVLAQADSRSPWTGGSQHSALHAPSFPSREWATIPVTYTDGSQRLQSTLLVSEPGRINPHRVHLPSSLQVPLTTLGTCNPGDALREAASTG